MKLKFNFNTIGGLFRSFSEPTHERKISLSSGKLKVQVRGTGSDAKFCLRFGSFGSVSYYEMDRAEFMNTAEAMIEIAEENAS